MALEPITRQEQIIAGKDLEPITRMEKFLKKYRGASSGGGGSGGFVLRPTVEELTIDGGVVCTTQYDEMAKALEAGSHVSIVIPPASLSPDVPFYIRASVNIWSYIDGMLVCSITAVGQTWDFSFINGTYVPKL